MNTILIIALIALIIVAIVNIKKVRTLNQERIELTSSNYERKSRINILETSVIAKDATARQQKAAISDLNVKISSLQDKQTKSKISNDKNLNTKIVLVTSPNGNEVVTNAKIKTIVGTDGKTTMYPTIRRKVKGAWKEVPVYMKTITDK